MEAVISRMKTVQASMAGSTGDTRNTPSRGTIRFLAVSATIPNADDVSAYHAHTVTAGNFFLCLQIVFRNEMIYTSVILTGNLKLCSSAYCKSIIFRMHFIFLYFVRGGLRTKIKCALKGRSKSENLQRSVPVQKLHVYERSEVPSVQKLSAYEIFWIYSMLNHACARGGGGGCKKM